MLIITRPREQASQWVQDLQARGIEAVAVPLLEIEPTLADPQRQQAWEGLKDHALVVFVSPNAVTHFFGAACLQGPVSAARPWPITTWAAAPGQGTADALLRAGVPPERILQPPADALQFDSESLWPVLAAQSWEGRRALIVRGEGGREWLSEQLRLVGAQVDHLGVYGRRPPRWTSQEWSWVQSSWKAPASSVWLFSSSEALSHLPPLMKEMRQQGRCEQDPFTQWAGAVAALATHPRIGEQAHRLGLVRTRVCRPSVEEVAQAVAEYNRAHRES